MSTPFLLSLDEVEQMTCLCGLTLMRQEKLGRFPKRVKISSRRIAYLGAEIEDWLRDPEAWRQRDSAKIAAVTQADTVRPEGVAG
jgi:predicted DNA-binding transcriptional regulator AlpA